MAARFAILPADEAPDHNDQLEARADVAAIGEALGLVLRRSVHTCGGCPACFDEAIADAERGESSTELSHPSVTLEVAS